MSKPIIEVNNITKRYRLGSIGVGSFIDDLKVVGKKIGLPCSPSDPAKQFIALDDISFSVEKGEVLGIIGHNGAGKSTLLKILSRITEPTSGSAVLRGRVASLLEVGTGFHGELSGMDNIFLNGSLNGLTKDEINEKLDDIIEFAQIGKYIDTPVKRYSSGMYVRLAFAVAAHLDPDILIIDEVLAVGDLAFQKKCISKMGSVSKEGKTVLIVSHQMSIINQLCDRCIMIDSGKIKYSGNPQACVGRYFGISSKESSSEIKDKVSHGPKIYSNINNLKILNSSSKNANTINFGENIRLYLNIKILVDVKNFEIGFSFRRQDGFTIGTALNNWNGFQNTFSTGTHSFEINVDKNNLIPGEYFITVWTKIDNDYVDCQMQNALEFSILNASTDLHVCDFTRYPHAGTVIQSKWKLVST
jgi:lipopolysaccharide transport system ATP-binding protein